MQSLFECGGILGNFLRMMREGVQNMKNEMKGNPPVGPDEKILRRKAQYIDVQWDQLSEVSRAVRLSTPLISLSHFFGSEGRDLC